MLSHGCFDNAASAESTLRYGPAAARAIGLQTLVLSASTSAEIDAAFATIVRERADALFVAPDSFFIGSRMQFASLTARNKIPAAYADRDIVEAGGLMSYGTDFSEMSRQMGIYTGRILKGERPADLPVLQLNKFELVINLQTARVLGLAVPAHLPQLADEGVE